MSNAPRIDSIEQTLDNSPRNPNKFINGNFDFWQRGTSAAFTSNAQYLADRWQIGRSNNYPGSFEVTCSQGTPPTFAESGVSSNHSLRCEVTSGATTIPNNSIMAITQKLEGYDSVDMFGDKEVSYSFWFKTNVEGKYHISLFTSLAAQRYVKSFTISAADAAAENWVKVQGTIPMVDRDISEINTDHNLGLSFSVTLDCGSDFFGVDGEWNNSIAGATAGVPNWSGTLGNYAEIAQMMLHIGDVPQPYTMAGRNIADEFEMCRRYFKIIGGSSAAYPVSVADAGVSTNTTTIRFTFNSAMGMRRPDSESGTKLVQYGTLTVFAAAGGDSETINLNGVTLGTYKRREHTGLLSLTANTLYFISNSTSGRLGFDDEL